MAMKTILVNSERFVSVNALVEAMVATCVRYTDVNEISVDEWEANRVATFQSMIRDELKDVPGLLDKFKDTYVHERFIKRTIGV